MTILVDHERSVALGIRCVVLSCVKGAADRYVCCCLVREVC